MTKIPARLAEIARECAETEDWYNFPEEYAATVTLRYLEEQTVEIHPDCGCELALGDHDPFCATCQESLPMTCYRFELERDKEG